MKKVFVATMIWAISSSTLLMAQSSTTPPSKTPKKMLVTYFSVPESDGVDASTGASRLIANDKIYGATEYVAKVISDATSADLFQIKTVQAYPSRSHKELIEYAKVISIPAISRNNAAQSRKEVEDWLKKQGFAKK